MYRVDELRRVRSAMQGLRDEEERLSVPIVMNMGMIRNLYDVFMMSLRRQNPSADPTDTQNRKKFLYAVLYVCSPATLVGNVMRHKLRECVSSVIGCTPTGVSRDYKTAVFFYATYADFRDSVDVIVRDMLDTLEVTDKI